MNNDINILLLGILVSIIFFEFTEISPGGIIVPGLMALYINDVEMIVFTIAVSIITFFIVKLLSKYVIIFGKRRFVLMILVSLVVNLILEFILKGLSISLVNISIIGYTIAGLIANDIYKQGIKRTIPSLVITTLIIELIVLLTGAIS